VSILPSSHLAWGCHFVFMSPHEGGVEDAEVGEQYNCDFVSIYLYLYL
jgi:hypothetical protein